MFYLRKLVSLEPFDHFLPHVFLRLQQASPGVWRPETEGDQTSVELCASLERETVNLLMICRL